MSSSLPDKLFDGQTGFPTPNAAPDTNGCRVFIVPDDEEWFALLMGAVLRLTQEWAWYKNGAMTPAEAAAAWSVIIDDAYERSLVDTCSATIPAPYWDEDSGDDADDEADTENQPWYGELSTDGVTWTEQVGIWAITAFVAVSATPAAAIAFLPFANRFVLAFKQHSAGAIIKVLIDGVEMARADTYAPSDGILNVPISLPVPTGFMAFDSSSPQLLVVMTDEVNPAVTGTPSMQVIRKRLDQTEITPANLRWDSECDCVQQTPDNGVTWVDSPSQDPRSSTIFQVPARTIGDPRCDSAQQMHDRVKHMLDAIIASSDILQAINSVIGVIAVFFFEFGIVIEAIWAIVSAIFSIGTTVLAAALTDDQYDLLLCIFYCNIGSDGTVDETQFAEIQSKITAQLNSTAAFAINQALDSIGFVGLTNAGALGEVTGDCSACTTCFTAYVWDFRISDGGFVFDSEAATTGGVYVGGGTHGYEKSATGIPDPPYDAGRKSVTFDIPSTCHITTITTSQDDSDGGLDDHLECYIGTSRSAGLAQMPHIYEGHYGTTSTATGDISNQTGVHLTWEFANNSGGGDWYTIRIDWTGDQPTGLSGGAFV